MPNQEKKPNCPPANLAALIILNILVHFPFFPIYKQFSEELQWEINNGFITQMDMF